MKSWYLAYCKHREEQRAQIHLKNQGIDSYFPQVEVERILRGQRLARPEPLFPNYLFVHVDLETFSPSRLRSTRGLRSMVRSGAHWTQVPKALIYQLMSQEDSDEARALLRAVPQPGERVLIKAGPFKGLEAIFQEQDGERRSILLINMLHQPVCSSFCNQSFSRIG